MIYANIENQEDRKLLEQELRSARDKDWYCRLQIISLSAQNHSVKKLSQMFRLCEATVRNYIHSYNAGGVDNLKPVKQTGRPPKIAHWNKEQWDSILVNPPNEYEKLGSNSHQWTLELLQLYLKEYRQIEVSVASIYNSLHRAGKRTGRGKLGASSHVSRYRQDIAQSVD